MRRPGNRFIEAINPRNWGSEAEWLAAGKATVSGLAFLAGATLTVMNGQDLGFDAPEAALPAIGFGVTAIGLGVSAAFDIANMRPAPTPSPARSRTPIRARVRDGIAMLGTLIPGYPPGQPGAFAAPERD